MAGRQRHLVDIGGVPRRHDEPARIGVLADAGDDIGDLVDGAAVARRPRAPLRAIDRAEIALLIGPFVPDGYAMVAQILDIGVAAQEPQQLMDDGAQMQLLGGDQRKTAREIEAHLMAEDRKRAGSGAVVLADAVVAHMAHEVEILLHGRI